MGDLCVWAGMMHKIGASWEIVPMFGGSSFTRGIQGGRRGCSMEGMEEV